MGMYFVANHLTSTEYQENDMSDSMTTAARGIHQAQAEYMESLASAALAIGMEEIHELRDKARELYGPEQAHMVKDLRNAANRDENGEAYVSMSNQERVNLTRSAFDVQEEIRELTVKLEKILSRLIHDR